jgi:hypothetical protein
MHSCVKRLILVALRGIRVAAAWLGHVARRVVATLRRSRTPGLEQASIRRKYAFGAIDRQTFDAATLKIRRRRRPRSRQHSEAATLVGDTHEGVAPLPAADHKAAD